MSDILEQLATAVIKGDVDAMEELTEDALDEDLGAKEILDNGLMVGMDHVGVEFKAGNLFVPEVLRSAKAMKTSMAILQPLLSEAGAEAVGKIVIGTVKGDLHDIGKNLVGMMCEGAGFEVINLGTDVEADQFLAAIKEYEPHIVGMSALLTTTMRAMGDTVKAIEEAGLRDKVKVMIGGAPVTQNFADDIGADGYAANAASAADLAKVFVGAG
ncbi:MAG: corrinoid protein [Anaerolineae bacterium]|jgi:5-methyltetrahydrofolate--homocysteine methyltransferase